MGESDGSTNGGITGTGAAGDSRRRNSNKRQRLEPPPPSLGPRLVLSCAASAVSETCTFPIDMVKTRLQLQVQRTAQRAAR
eukprot:m.28788 g.28788  ORF g.28788 m.28788 type:complete len:81 (+) comp8934_c0_seq2:17-259(+)